MLRVANVQRRQAAWAAWGATATVRSDCLRGRRGGAQARVQQQEGGRKHRQHRADRPGAALLSVRLQTSKLSRGERRLAPQHCTGLKTHTFDGKHTCITCINTVYLGGTLARTLGENQFVL